MPDTLKTGDNKLPARFRSTPCPISSLAPMPPCSACPSPLPTPVVTRPISPRSGSSRHGPEPRPAIDCRTQQPTMRNSQSTCHTLRDYAPPSAPPRPPPSRSGATPCARSAFPRRSAGPWVAMLAARGPRPRPAVFDRNATLTATRDPAPPWRQGGDDDPRQHRPRPPLCPDQGPDQEGSRRRPPFPQAPHEGVWDRLRPPAAPGGPGNLRRRQPTGPGQIELDFPDSQH